MIIIMVLLLLVVGAVALNQAGVLNLANIKAFGNNNDVEAPVSSSELGFSDEEIYYMLCRLTDKDLNRAITMDYIDQLDMQVYGSNAHYVTIAEEYRTLYGDYTNVLDNPVSAPHGGGRIMMWTNSDAEALSVLTASTQVIQDVYNYQTMTLTASGSEDEFTNFYLFVVTS